MTSTTAAIEPILASSIRVLRDITSKEELIRVWPWLNEKSHMSPSTLTHFERRLFLDLPDKDMETSNIAAITGLSREQLIEKAVSEPELLTQDEVVLLQDRFWAHVTDEENSSSDRALRNTSLEGREAYYVACSRAFLPDEEAAFTTGITEFWKREQAKVDDKLSIKAQLALPSAKEWIQYLYRQENMHWGFVCLYDAAAQLLAPARLAEFSFRMENFFSHALNYNGSKDIIHRKWIMLPFNAPKTAFASTSSLVSDQTIGSETVSKNVALLRKAFHQILQDPRAYQDAEDVTPRSTPTQHFKNGIAGSGILTNTFLVIDPVCIESVLMNDGQWYDDFRVLAFEAEQVSDREYIEGYHGFTWVRLDQLVYNFYELRLMNADEVGMDEIWKAAQESPHRAFISMDPEEALSRTGSCRMSGFTRDSILGARCYAVKDAARQN